MTTVYVAYPGDQNTRFDRVYYREKHLPLVTDCWSALGLEGLAVFYPENDGGGCVAICACRFRDEDAVRASFGSERTREVMDDIARFTDTRPQQQRIIPLNESEE